MDRNSLEQVLKRYIDSTGNLDAIVVEGYDGVGKGRVLNQLSEILGVIPYRPDYNLWQKYDHRPIDRWKVSGFFWDIYRHFKGVIGDPSAPMLFDRGVLSGAAYRNGPDIEETYKKLIEGFNVLHILVVCQESDYYKFMEIRGIPREEALEEYSRYVDYTNRYLEIFKNAEVSYMIYENYFDEEIASNTVDKCVSCGHYSYGWCRHPDKNCMVDGDSCRCEKSKDKEVQDINGNEMQCV